MSGTEGKVEVTDEMVEESFLQARLAEEARIREAGYEEGLAAGARKAIGWIEQRIKLYEEDEAHWLSEGWSKRHASKRREINLLKKVLEYLNDCYDIYFKEESEKEKARKEETKK